jgi:hypothetical protein
MLALLTGFAEKTVPAGSDSCRPARAGNGRAGQSQPIGETPAAVRNSAIRISRGAFKVDDANVDTQAGSMDGGDPGPAEAPMRRVQDVTTILGALALAGSLALLSPGVRVVRADDTAAPTASTADADGPTCEAGTLNGGAEVLEYLEKIQRLQRERMAASPEVAADADDFVALGNRGYNHGPSPVTFPSAVEFENR